MNLAVPFWGLAEPGAAEKKKIGETSTYTLWDRWDISLGESTTLKQLVDYFMVSYHTKNFSFFLRQTLFQSIL